LGNRWATKIPAEAFETSAIVSPVDIQQCADSVIRLHAEWKWSQGDKGSIAYHFLSGDLAKWPAFAGGSLPIIEGNKVRMK